MVIASCKTLAGARNVRRTVNPKPLRHVDLFSSAGKLEALYRESPGSGRRGCGLSPTSRRRRHHAQQSRLPRRARLEAANVATLRFNFRGTSNSAGKHEGGEGEQGDVVAAIDWLMKMHPGKKVIVGGFSFGAWVARARPVRSPPSTLSS